MRIGMIAPPWFPLPPQRYGGIESVVSLLTEGLVARGHEVTLFASGDSETRAALSYVFARAPFERMEDGGHLEIVHSLAAYLRADEFDVIHDHDGLAGRAMGAVAHRLIGTPVVATLHGPADPDTKLALTALRADLRFIAISDSQRLGFPDLDFAGTIPNAIDVEHMPYCTEKDDYLLFVGRMTPDKGAHTAVDVSWPARSTRGRSASTSPLAWSPVSRTGSASSARSTTTRRCASTSVPGAPCSPSSGRNRSAW